MTNLEILAQLEKILDKVLAHINGVGSEIRAAEKKGRKEPKIIFMIKWDKTSKKKIEWKRSVLESVDLVGLTIEGILTRISGIFKENKLIKELGWEKSKKLTDETAKLINLAYGQVEIFSTLRPHNESFERLQNEVKNLQDIKNNSPTFGFRELFFTNSPRSNAQIDDTDLKLPLLLDDEKEEKKSSSDKPRRKSK